MLEKFDLEKLNLRATYSPEDNKLRFYCSERLELELYNIVRANGFGYAPKQELFVCPRWTPARMKFLTNLCGSVGDELTSLEERTLQRSERFEGYQSNREDEANVAYNESLKLAETTCFGEPIKIGHHSEKKARKRAEKIDKTMQTAVIQWEKAEYWQSRIKGVTSNLKYKEKTPVRLRRIKKLEAEKRKFIKITDKAQATIELWNNSEKELNIERAKYIANYFSGSFKFPLDIYPRGKDKSQYEGSMSLWSALDFITPEQAKTLDVENQESILSYYADWINHITLRIDYENEVLKAQGYIEPVKVSRPKLPPIVNYNGEGFISLTKEEYKKVGSDYRFCRTVLADGVHGEHRVRFVCNARLKIKGLDHWGSSKIFITNQKIVEVPNAE